MNTRILRLSCAVALSLRCGAPGDPNKPTTPPAATSPATTKPAALTINRATPKASELDRLQRALGTRPTSGDFWYDSRSGLAGRIGGYAQWVIGPGYDFGPLPKDASAGTTGVFYNGRELPYAEAVFVCWLYEIDPMNIPYFAGRYLLDANGNLYTTDATNLPGQWLGNLVQLAQQKGARTSGGTGGDGPWSTSGGAAGNSSGGCSYVAIPNSSGGFTSASSGCG